jgi:imidazoleglycerol phosphate dehydratase HisB
MERATDSEQGTLQARIELGGSGQASVATGLPVLDHLLGLVASHAGFDLRLEVAPGGPDAVASAAGRALGEALRDPLRAEGATGWGYAMIPADEALANVVLEVSDRPLLVSNVDLSNAHVAGLDRDLVSGFLRELTEEAGALLVFDEVISFRVGYAGAQGRYGVTPDLTTLGKIIGGGLPIGAFGGRADVMALFDPRSESRLSHGGTFNGNPLSMAAGLATLAELVPQTYERLERLGAELRTKLSRLFAEVGQPASVNQIGSLFNIHLIDRPVRDHADVFAADTALLRELHLAMLGHGILFTPRGMGCLSTPMTSTEVDAFVEATRLGLADLGRRPLATA